MTTATGAIALKDFSKKILDAIGMGVDNHDLSFLDLVNKRAYNRIRKNINAAIGVGDIERFTGFVQDETEMGDITDSLVILLEEAYPGVNYATSNRAISLDEQRAFRDKLIEELDEMVGR